MLALAEAVIFTLAAVEKRLLRRREHGASSAQNAAKEAIANHAVAICFDQRPLGFEELNVSVRNQDFRCLTLVSVS